MESKALRNFLVAKGSQVLVIVIVRVVLLIVCVFVRVHSSGCQTRNSAGEAVKNLSTLHRLVASLGESARVRLNLGRKPPRNALPFGMNRRNDLYGLQGQHPG